MNSHATPELAIGNKAVWNELCESLRVGLASKANRLLRSGGVQGLNPGDLVQETLMRAWTNRHKFQGTTVGQFAKWLVTIQKNIFVDRYRKPNREVFLSTWFGVSRDQETPSAAAVCSEQQGELLVQISALEFSIQQVICLRHIEGMKFQEIATRTNQNINTVVGRYRRGIQSLQKSFALDGLSHG